MWKKIKDFYIMSNLVLFLMGFGILEIMPLVLIYGYEPYSYEFNFGVLMGIYMYPVVIAMLMGKIK